MTIINRMFREPATPLVVSQKPVEKKAPRAKYKNSTTDVKFPVTKKEWEAFCKMAIAQGMEGRQTYANTHLLKKALNDPEIINASYGQETVKDELGGVYYTTVPGIVIEYQDSKQYLHVKPNVEQHKLIQELKFKWGLRSKRQVVHRLMIAAIRRYPFG